MNSYNESISSNVNIVNKVSNNSGKNKFLGRDTLTSVVNKCVEEFFEFYDSYPGKLSPAEIERRLTTQINNEIMEHNATCANNKWTKLKALPHDVIGKVLFHLENIVLISHTDKIEKSNDFASLAIYDPDKGTYDISEKAFEHKIREYYPGITIKGLAEVISYLKSEAEQVVLNKDKNLTAVNNGIYNRATGQLEPFRPDFIAVKKILTDYNPDAENVFVTMPDGEVWDCESQIDSFSDDPEVQQLLRDVMTAVVFPYNRWDKAFMPYSTVGNNGKGTFCKMIREMLGDEIHTSISLKELGTDFLCSELLDHNVVITDENDVGSYIDSAERFKEAVTHDKLTINRKYKSVIKMRWRGVMIQCLNGFPRFQDRSKSILRRFLIIPFEKCFTGEERRYIKDEYLERQDVREYYLKMALERELNEISIPSVCEEVLEEYQSSNNSTYEFFISEVCNYQNWEYIPMSFLFEHYKAWYKTYYSGIPLGLGQFRVEIVNAALQDPEHHFIEAEPSAQKFLPSDAMCGAENAIIAYSLERYMNKAYHGSDPEKICNFARPKKTRGYLRRNMELDAADDSED